VTDAYSIDESALAVAGILERLNKRRTAKKHRLFRVIVATGVAVMHMLVIMLLIETRIVVTTHEKPPHETQLLWLLLPRAVQSSGNQAERQAEEMIRQAYKAVQLLPNVVDSPRPNAITVDPGLALGQALACGAGAFEYLTPEGRLRCGHRPWNFIYDRYGYIILNTQERPAQAEKPRPSDVMAHQRNTAPECPANVNPNVPCLERIIRGN